jgi:6-phosphogluconolactonase
VTEALSPDLQVVDDPGAAAAELLVACARAGEHVALTGGSTPRAAYEAAAAAGADWSGAELWWSDERCVPPDDELSNFGLARSALLARIAGPAPSVHPMPGELGPHEGAAAYERELHDCFGAGMPELDLVLLGLGADGHCASLFPEHPALEETERLVVGIDEPGLEPMVPRVTFTLPLINAARRVVFLVVGVDKAPAVAQAFEGTPSAATPASLVEPASGQLTVLLDPAAASQLREGPT